MVNNISDHQTINVHLSIKDQNVLNKLLNEMTLDLFNFCDML